MSVLVDTSVWVAHFRQRDDALVELLALDLTLIHPMVMVELACGTPPVPRVKSLSDLRLLRQSNQASMNEVLEFIEHEKLYGLGCGLVDITLLASTLITPGAMLWTLDKRLASLAKRFGVAHRLDCH
ncbi:type II toxin-antitoxin system VapC family toxin [Noviherbaspirillum sp.]|uniref:type II toxin-antitoxin system VapC family toxin n=1 Tax=Noviherbaspirillum sp. TaxID=1926288 RepID=UPI002FE14647